MQRHNRNRFDNEKNGFAKLRRMILESLEIVLLLVTAYQLVAIVINHSFR